MLISGIAHRKRAAADVKAIVAFGWKMFHRMLPIIGPMINPEPNAAEVAPNPVPLFAEGMLVASHEK